MCGRFVSARKRLELLEEFGVLRDRVSEDLAPDYNVAPTKQIYAVTSSKEGERELRTVRWGLIPVWAKDISGGVTSRKEGGGERRPVRGGLIRAGAKDTPGGAKMITPRPEPAAENPAYP